MGIKSRAISKIKNYSNLVKFEHSIFALPFGIAAFFLVVKNTEISYLGVTDSNGNTTFPSEYRDEGVANSNEVPLRVPTSPINVTLHNHATITQNPNNTPVIGNGSLPIHSPSDLYGIYDYYINGNIDNTDNYVNIVITPDQTLYAITISNESDFQANASKFLQAI